MKLSISDLNFQGGLVPEDQKSIKDMILTTYNNCLVDGAETLQLPDEPLSYTDLIKVLTDKGLIKSSCSTSGSSQATPSPSQTCEATDLLSLTYKKEVKSEKVFN